MRSAKKHGQTTAKCSETVSAEIDALASRMGEGERPDTLQTTPNANVTDATMSVLFAAGNTLLIAKFDWTVGVFVLRQDIAKFLCSQYQTKTDQFFLRKCGVRRHAWASDFQSSLITSRTETHMHKHHLCPGTVSRSCWGPLKGAHLQLIKAHGVSWRCDDAEANRETPEGRLCESEATFRAKPLT